MKYLVVADTPRGDAPNFSNLIYTASNNVAVSIRDVEVLLVENWTNLTHVHSVLSHIEKSWPELGGCLFLTAVGWGAFLTLFDASRPILMDYSGYRGVATLGDPGLHRVVIKVANYRTDLNAVSEYMKWLKLEVEYSVSRSYYSDTSFGRS